jgi:hypothetical protein
MASSLLHLTHSFHQIMVELCIITTTKPFSPKQVGVGNGVTMYK